MVISKCDDDDDDIYIYIYIYNKSLLARIHLYVLNLIIH